MLHAYRAHWIALLAVTAGGLAVIAAYAPRIEATAPPIPEQVVGPRGEVVLDGAAIRRGQNAWQSIGGEEVGSVWGHGAYVAPDWSADWLHRESVFVLDGWARAAGAKSYEALAPERRAALRERLREQMRTNTYDASTGKVTLGAERAEAFSANAAHYARVFRDGQDAYAIPRGALSDPGKLRDLAAFFWWTSWAAGTQRPGEEVTYTQNWPHEPLIGNRPTGEALVWSVVSFVLLLAGIGALVWYQGGREEHGQLASALPERDPLFGLEPTPSQRATVKYFWVVAALFVVQIALGAVTAHYGVEGAGFYGFPLADVLPYSVARTWHTQLGIFWIATAWLATGLYVGPAVSGFEPKGQRALVNVLFACLLVIVVGSLAGEWLSVKQRLGGDSWYWFGHQGYEYVDLGRFWQIFLFAGLFIWLFLMARALWPVLRRGADSMDSDQAAPAAAVARAPLGPGADTRPLLGLFLLSAVAIALFYGAGLMYGQHSHLAMVEYWRWWVVHLWVEGFFEVFATVVIAFLFVRLKLLEVHKATTAVFFSTAIFLAGGIIGTFHHLYFSGTPSGVLALGAVFSAFEVVPLVLVGLEVWQNVRLARAKDWLAAYRWPIYYFVAVAFWNLVGAGLFGFFINPPIALYYMQGLNTTPVHGHTALFGVYGMLGIGLMLFCLRALRPGAAWKSWPLALSFWLINGGLALMVLLSVLPVGLMQAWASVEVGTWWARSAEFMKTPLMDTLRWLRVPGDTIFAVGALVLGWFVLGLATGWSLERGGSVEAGSTEVKLGGGSVPGAARAAPEDGRR
ncbi:nitric-oxide reductase large subunit [Anaeromyxobacter diazotrophicus]|uniref:Nitric-oxide reductase large subunit n=1 Tax=Anaeromyxobacter diazotrophicus TaxID=2590199 RepID=A0A7I9VKC3_9BACT|nr:nitric-oxide reductase large subunit [Anaeromyxobacter diazotrophicus]GEJ56825.1 nitric-oxide reductase large subunit [Anaeromyxobacter diazotrophicus]